MCTALQLDCYNKCVREGDGSPVIEGSGGGVVHSAAAAHEVAAVGPSAHGGVALGGGEGGG